MRNRSKIYDPACAKQDRRNAKRWGFRGELDQARQGEPRRSGQQVTTSQGAQSSRIEPIEAARVPGSDQCSQIEPARAHRPAKSSRSRPEQTSQGEPGRSAGRQGAHGTARSSQSRPDQASQGEPGHWAGRPRPQGAARSSQSRPARASQGEPARSARRPGCDALQGRKRFTRISLLIPV